MASVAVLGLNTRIVAAGLLPACLFAAAGGLVFGYAPTEATMGDVQRILYLHVSVAWCGLAGALGMGVCAAGYLARRRLAWDHCSQASAEVAWLAVTLTLLTGSLWARAAWGVWWTWEPRLLSSLVLWLIFAGVFLVRAATDDPHRRARVGAALALLAVLDVPMVLLATRWFRGVHPVAPQMDGRMRVALYASVLAIAALFGMLAFRRAKQIALFERTAALEDRLDVW
jgi:heme exporter protein C